MIDKMEGRYEVQNHYGRTWRGVNTLLYTFEDRNFYEDCY